MNQAKTTVLSGIRATGKMHIGNYLGAITRFARMSQDSQYNCLFFVADMHTLTTLQDAQLIREHMPDIVIDYLAAGVDPNRASIYIQSSVPQVAELMWYLGCLCTVGQLQGLPTYKDKAKKAEKKKEEVNAGLLNYSILMAADILGPRAHLVPVGKDQTPHLEFTQHLAKKFNATYGEFFPIPDAMKEEMVLIPGLSLMNKERGDFEKMGKSEGNAINLADTPEGTWEKIRVAPVDPERKRRSDPGTPEHCAIYALHGFVSSADQIAWSHHGCRTAKIGCIDCKKVLSDNVNGLLAEFRENRRRLKERPDFVTEVLMQGRKKAERLFNETIEVVRERMGLIRF